jgi:transmembrane sensor
MTGVAEVEARAAQWLARRDRSDWTPACEVELDAWLSESTANRVAYLRLEAAWARADRLVALRAPRIAAQTEAEEQSRLFKLEVVRSPWRRRAPTTAFPRFALAAAAMVGVVVAGMVLFDSGTDHGVGSALLASTSYSTEVGQQRTLPLEDGSKVELNTDTRLRVAVTREHRTVWLDRGEAYFEVAHDSSRPFVVLAGTRRVTVLGTKFSVRRDGNEIQVKVKEGRVVLDEPSAAPPSAPAVVIGGDIAIARASQTLVAERSAGDLERELSWRQGRLSFDNSTLSDAAREFNRYNRKKLIVADPAVASIRLGGSFEARNVDAFARLLEQGFSLRVQIGEEQIVISN